MMQLKLNQTEVKDIVEQVVEQPKEKGSKLKKFAVVGGVLAGVAGAAIALKAANKKKYCDLDRPEEDVDTFCYSDDDELEKELASGNQE